ncbi:MAG: O-antigen ligase family protein [Steroidobacteraceae bacterium]
MTLSTALEPPSLFRDVLFAASSVLLISGFALAPLKHVPLFTAFSFVAFVVSLRSLFGSPYLKHLCVPPLMIFLAIHIGYAFRVTSANGVTFVLQGIVVCAFAAAFANRYAQVDMARYLRWTGIGMVMLLAYVIGYHLSINRYTSWKMLADAKAVFDVLPVMLLVLRRSQSPRARFLFPVLLPLFVVIILLSGERKAYILLVLFTPFLINFRSLATYVLPLIMALVVSVGLSFDRSGYVERQLNTFSQLAQGKEDKTGSDAERSWAIKHAAQLFYDHPLVGVGTNGYSRTVDLSIHESAGTHNEWLRVASENGMTGLFFFAATMIWGLVGVFRKRVTGRVRSRDEKLVAFAMFATLVIYLSFEALDFIVLTAFVLTSLVQFLRLDPNAGERAGARVSEGVVRPPASVRPLPSVLASANERSIS